MLILRHYFAVYIPTKDKNGRIILREIFEEMKSLVYATMDANFSGCTTTGAYGMYHGEGEEVLVCKSFCIEQRHDRSYADMIKLCEEIKIMGNQYSVAMESDGEMILV